MRREFLAVLGATVVSCAQREQRETTVTAVTSAAVHRGMPFRKLGRDGVTVSALALGGYHIGSVDDDALAIRIVHEAIDNGITFLDNAWDYNDGRSEEIVGRALAQGKKRDAVFLMTKVCTHGRDAKVALAQLEQSLRRLRTDHVDLWQVHEVIYDNEPDLHHAKDGVVTALERARRDGKVRYVGFTGHKDPRIHLRMLSFAYPFDTVQLPLNPMDAHFRSFEALVLPVLQRRNIAAIGMKPFGGTAHVIEKGILTPDDALRYAMSLPVVTTVTGIDSLEVLRQDLRIARDFVPMTPEEMAAVRKRVAPYAGDGRFEIYKTSMFFDGEEGRRVHGYPEDDELTY